MAMTATTCRSFILDTAKKLNRAFGYLDLPHHFKYGTLRNTVSGLRKEGKILRLPKENPTRFILSAWKNRPEYRRAFQNDNTPMGGRVKVVGQQLTFDFLSFIESLDWSELGHVHDVKLEFDVGRVSGVSSDAGWCWSSRSRSWLRKFDALEFPVTVQFYDTGRVQVSVRCSLRPIAFNFRGLTRLSCVLGELKGRLWWNNVPNVADWVVTSWHYGKDSVKEVSGTSFNVTFGTWSKAFARIYAKSELRKVRAEEIRSPNRSLQELFETLMMEGETATKNGESQDK